MVTPKQAELISRLIDLTNAQKIGWEKYNSPRSFLFRQGETKYIVNNYKTISDEKQYDCISLVIMDENGRPVENCVGCDAAEYINDYNALVPLYASVIQQYSGREDREIENLLQSLPV